MIPNLQSFLGRHFISILTHICSNTRKNNWTSAVALEKQLNI